MRANVAGFKVIYFLLFCFLSAPLFAQDLRTVRVIPEIEKKFEAGLTKYREKDYSAAFAQFEPLINAQVLHQRTTASLLMAGRSLYELKRFDDAEPYFQRLIEFFPYSNYRDDAFFFTAASEYQTGQYVAAAKNFIKVIESSTDESILDKSKRALAGIIRSKLSLAEAHDLPRYAQTETSAAVVTLALARKELSQGSTEKVVQLLKDHQKKYGFNLYKPQFAQILKEAEGNIVHPLKIGLILPLSGPFKEEGLGVLSGIKFAQSTMEAPVQLVIRDSESNMIKAIHATRNLIERERVRSIIGELESEITAGIGALAARDNIPVISPAATENEVASVGETVYQLNSDLERKGGALAEYAFRQLGLRSFATLAPADEYGQQMIASFTSRIDALGGQIVAQSWYYGNPEDVSRQFNAIRQAAFHRDSVDVEKMIREARRNGQKLEEKEIAVTSIDAVFLPIYTQDIPYVAPQFAFSNIRAQILGGEYWDNLDLLSRQQVQPYVNGAIFVSDFFPDEQDSRYRDFRTQFRLKMRTSPERWEVFGYDSFRVIAEAIREGAQTGPEINSKLNSMNGFEGMKGDISFRGNQRVNSEVNILQFVKGQIIKHQMSGE